MFIFDKKTVDVKEINKMLKCSSKLKKVIGSEFSGWADFVKILDGYCNSMLNYKKNFNISTATDEQIFQLKMYDRDVWLINNFIKKIPENFITNLENEIKKSNEEEDFNKIVEDI